MTHDIFQTFPGESKLWVYQCSRELEADEINFLEDELKTFLENWDSHGSIPTSDYAILYNRFIVIVVDDTKDRLCGGAADRSIQFIKRMETELDTDLMDRMNLAYKEGDTVKSVNINDFRAMLADGKLNEDTIVFNNVINKLSEFSEGWEVPMKESWHKQMLGMPV